MPTANMRQTVAEIIGDLLAYEASEEFSESEWYEVRWVAAQAALASGHPNSEDVPHVIWHYLSDADIRAKDKDYADRQIAAVKEALGL